MFVYVVVIVIWLWGLLFQIIRLSTLLLFLAVYDWVNFTEDLPTHVSPSVCMDNCGVNLQQSQNGTANYG